MHAHRRTWAALAATLALATGAPALATAPEAPAHIRSLDTAVSGVMQASPYCGITWGSLARSNGTTHTTGTVEDVRAGRHTCFDRLVIDVDDVPGSLTYDVRYVDAVRADGSGQVVPLSGGADLRIILRAPAYEDGAPTYDPTDPAHLVAVAGWSTFRQVALAGSFEGQTTVGLGVRARLPFRVLVLDGPGDGARLVVDVAHRW
ncbi:AMIN-like domain-containing (lipo)protein [Ornithinimicrobium cavernae]|uniref:AMIN-like domain-containing (lipo)protein n=1 Tax=Ornithinimicrobium cavernae TaxID=2666047 RepID=UPI000D69AD43|nr:hypothetical protein [Ornithinimicrobium cavernae]